jgi:hypothetical protein
MRKIITAAVAAVLLMVVAAAGAPTSAAASTDPGPLDYHGGDVMYDDPAVALIFWGSWWTTTSAGKAAADEMHRLFYGLGKPFNKPTGDPWSHTLTQYWQRGCPADPNKQPCSPGSPRSYIRMDSPAQTFCKSPAHSYDACFDNSQPPAQPSGKQIGDEISKWDGEKTMNVQAAAIYALFLPPKVVPPAYPICGYHTFHKDLSQLPNGIVYYLPVMVVSYDKATTDCSAGLGPSAGLSITAAHEFAEAVTDPFGDISNKYAGWLTSSLTAPSQEEIADLCEGVTVFPLKLPTGTFEMPQLWSLKVGHCVKTT